MPVTFKSKHSPDILMLDGPAVALLKMMGHSGTVPGSLSAADIPAALAKLETALAAAPDRALEPTRDQGDDEDREAPVSLAHRALPLRAMLRTAARENDYLYWEH